MISLEQLVARQVETWELKHRLEQEEERPPQILVKQVPYGPCLLVSREHGSGGDRVTRLVGERLGWQVYNRELLDEIASRAHVREQLIERVDERIRSRWLALHSGMDADGVSPETYLYCLRQVVEALGHHGDVIIVGRGAQYILPSACALRVLLVAPLDVRTRRVAESEQMTLEQARQYIEKLDAERHGFIQKTFHHDLQSPLNYDLVVNTGDISLEAAAEIVLLAMQKKLKVPAAAKPAGSPLP